MALLEIPLAVDRRLAPDAEEVVHDRVRSDVEVTVAIGSKSRPRAPHWPLLDAPTGSTQSSPHDEASPGPEHHGHGEVLIKLDNSNRTRTGVHAGAVP